MQTQGDPILEQRGGCLTLTLAAGLCGFLLVAAVIVTGGLVIYFLVPLALLAAFVGLNYLLWGWAMPAPAAAEAPPAAEDAAPGTGGDGFTELAPDDPRRARHD